jgi:hypothetical protein
MDNTTPFSPSARAPVKAPAPMVIGPAWSGWGRIVPRLTYAPPIGVEVTSN